jgi:hypothetical protein
LLSLTLSIHTEYTGTQLKDNTIPRHVSHR